MAVKRLEPIEKLHEQQAGGTRGAVRGRRGVRPGPAGSPTGSW